MNNALFQEESAGVTPHDTTEQQASLIRMIEAVNGLLQSADWQTLRDLHFSKEEERLNRLILQEAKKATVDDTVLYRLQGELVWAKRYADVTKFAQILKSQLDNLKNGQR